MSRIVFKYIEAENFKSFGPKIYFDYLKHSGLNYIYGTNLDIPGTENGSGKSNFANEIISYCIYGRTLKNTNNSYIPNRVYSALNPKIPCKVEVCFEIDENEYIVRSISGNKIRNRFEVFKNREDVSKSSIIETRKWLINDVLKCSFDLFRNSIILSSSDVDNFFLMNRSKKREWIDTIFKINVFGLMLKDIRNDINIIDKEFLLLQRENKNLEENSINIKNKMLNFETENINKINELKAKFNFKINRRKEIEEEVETFKNSSTSFIDEKIKYDNKLKEISEAKIKLQQLSKSIDRELKISDDMMKKHSEIIEIICGECKDKVCNKLSIVESQNTKNELILKNQEYKISIDKLNIVEQKINEKISEINNKIKEYEEKNKEHEKNKWLLDHLASDIEKLTVDIENLEKSKNPFGEIYEESKNKIETNEKILRDLHAKKMKLNILESVVNEDGAKRFIVKDLIDGMNNLIRKYLEEMGAHYTAIFDTNFDCTFLTSTGECDYTSFSSGERKRIDIAILLTFKDILSTTSNIDSNILVLDEILDSNIDNFAINALISILKRDISISNRTIFLVSFRGIDAEEFDNVIEIQKKNNMSNIVKDVQGEIYGKV